MIKLETLLIDLNGQSVVVATTDIYVPVKCLGTSTHYSVFLYFLLFSTLLNNSVDIKTMK
jgi:hypothetical protein